MIEQVIKLTQGNEKVVERLLVDEHIHYAHIILPAKQSVPQHLTNAQGVYMTVIRGTLSIELGEQGIHEYTAGCAASGRCVYAGLFFRHRVYHYL